MIVRGIYNDGQSLNTPELQRTNDIAGSADDRVYDAMVGIRTDAGGSFKRVLPLGDVDEDGGAALGYAPSRIAVVSGGAPLVRPCLFHAVTAVGGSAMGTSAIKMSALLDTLLAAPAPLANSSGSTRYDLIYAVVNRTAPADITTPGANKSFAAITGPSLSTGASQTRKIKNVSSGIIASQAINVYDVPTITLVKSAGFKTGAVIPSDAEIAAALPADSATAYNFAICYLTLANGYTAATLTQAMVTQCWEAGRIPTARLERNAVPSIYRSGITQDSGLPVTTRWGGMNSMLLDFKIKDAAATSFATACVLDSVRDWRYRMIVASVGYVGSMASTALTAPTMQSTPLSNIKNLATGQGVMQIALTGQGSSMTGDPGVFTVLYNTTTAVKIAVDITTGHLIAWLDAGTVIDNANGDHIVGMVQFSDQFIF